MKVMLSYLPLVGCIGVMVACMRMMGGRSRDQAKPDTREVTELRKEVARLRAQVAVPSGREPATRE